MTLLPTFPGPWPGVEVDFGDHLCLPVGSDAERLAGTAGFADLGLRRGGKVMIFAHTETPDEVIEYLVAQVPAAEAALTRGQLAVLACRDFYLTGGVFDVDRLMVRYATQIDLAQQQGYPGLWAAADMTWALPDTGSLFDYEVTVNPGFADRRVAGLCLYDRNRFSPEVIERICRAHPLTPGQAPLRFSRTTDPPGLALSGEVDLTNRDALDALLISLQALPGHITIDATGLLFADLHAADMMAKTCAARGWEATTLTGSPIVNRLLELMHSTGPTAKRWFDA